MMDNDYSYMENLSLQELVYLAKVKMDEAVKSNERTQKLIDIAEKTIRIREILNKNTENNDV